MVSWGEPTGQGWTQIVELTIALVCSALIGWERGRRQKSAGLRTHTLIGFSAALIVLVSKYGFGDVLSHYVLLDPSRVAAQIVSGIGFIGGGLIFVKRDAVRGLTTAASVWLTTAVGMAAGAGLPLLAVATTAGYFFVLYGLPALSTRARHTRPRTYTLEVVYDDGKGVLRTILTMCTQQGWRITGLTTRAGSTPSEVETVTANLNRRDLAPAPAHRRDLPTVAVVISMDGTGHYELLAAGLSELPRVHTVHATTPDTTDTDLDPELDTDIDSE